jgi:hypothetical protein
VAEWGAERAERAGRRGVEREREVLLESLLERMRCDAIV